MNNVIYKIQNQKTGEFATAQDWSKQGKSWNHMAHVRRHLSDTCRNHGINKYQNSEIVTYAMIEISRTPMSSLINETFEASKERERRKIIEAKKWEITRAKEQLKEAQEKLKRLGA